MKQKGISLIALIITIIVIIILAAITIFGVNGVVENARVARDEYERAALEEEINAILARRKMYQITGETRTLKEDLEAQLSGTKIIEEVRDDLCYVRRGNQTVTVYAEGMIADGRVMVWDGTLSSTFSEGTGTEKEPYIISNAEELAYFAQEVNGGRNFAGEYVKMINDIDLANKLWTPIGGNVEIGGEGESFAGNFDGGNHGIYGLNINYEENEKVGLFGILDEGGKISNLSIKSGSVFARGNAGAICGYSSGDFENCHNAIEVKVWALGDETANGNYGGGIVGTTLKGNIINCSNTGAITCWAQGYNEYNGGGTGGIAGFTTDTTVTNCENSGDIWARRYQGGGIIGRAYHTFVNDCVNYGEIRCGMRMAGGITGYLFGAGQINNCQNYGDVSSWYITAGGITGQMWDENDIVRNCQNYGTVWADDSQWLPFRGWWHYLGNPSQNVGGICGLMNNGKIEECTNTANMWVGGYYIGGIVGYMSAGSVNSCKNSGNVAAQSRERYSSTSCGSLSGGIVGSQSSGTITNCSNSGEVIAELQKAGGIVGNFGDGTIDGCSNTGKIIAKYNETATNSGLFSGGIAGYQDSGSITNSSNLGEIVAEVSIAGGIVGRSIGTITDCINTGAVKQSSLEVATDTAYKSGGISGDNQGTIEYCYNTGSVESANMDNVIDEIGGIVGLNRNGATVNHCYNQGKLTGGNTIGGVVGQLYDGTLEKNYYYSDDLNTAIGHNGTSYTEITPGTDVTDQAEKIDSTEASNITDFDSFKAWIQGK